jgi:hypothetical protein
MLYREKRIKKPNKVSNKKTPGSTVKQKNTHGVIINNINKEVQK